MRILLAEDSITSVQYIKKVINKNFKDVDWVIVSNGEEAITELKLKKFDIILLDWNMPKKKGYDVLLVLRSIKLNSSTPAVMITTEGAKTEIVSAIKAGVKGYIVKPFEEKTLVDKINELVIF